MENTYIVLYSDEFKEDIWKKYMTVLGLKESENEVKIIVKDVIVSENNYEE